MAIGITCCGLSIGHLINVIIVKLVTISIVSFRVASEDRSFIAGMRDTLENAQLSDENSMRWL